VNAVGTSTLNIYFVTFIRVCRRKHPLFCIADKNFDKEKRTQNENYTQKVVSKKGETNNNRSNKNGRIARPYTHTHPIFVFFR